MYNFQLDYLHLVLYMIKLNHHSALIISSLTQNFALIGNAWISQPEMWCLVYCEVSLKNLWEQVVSLFSCEETYIDMPIWALIWQFITLDFSLQVTTKGQPCLFVGGLASSRSRKRSRRARESTGAWQDGSLMSFLHTCSVRPAGRCGASPGWSQHTRVV